MKDKTVVIAGAISGLGKATALQLAQKGKCSNNFGGILMKAIVYEKYEPLDVLEC